MTPERLKEIREANRFWVEEFSTSQGLPCQFHRLELLEYVESLEREKALMADVMKALEVSFEQFKAIPIFFHNWRQIKATFEAFKNLEVQNARS